MGDILKLAATPLRPNYHRHARSCSFSNPGGGDSLHPSRTRDSAFGADETAPLLTNGTSRPGQHSVNQPTTKPLPVRLISHVFKTTWAVLSSNYVNVLLVFVPLGIISGALGWDKTKTFIFNFLAIVPLAGLLAFATEELSAKLGETIGGLMNATFGNAVELIVSIIALREGQIRIVQASMLGSILSNLLLVLGCCFIAGGIHHKIQTFGVTIAQTMASLMAVASVCLIIPATLYANIIGKDDPRDEILIISRGTAVIMLLLYILYLLFQLKTHSFLFVESNTQPKEDGSDQTVVTDNSNLESQQPQTDEYHDGETLSPISAGVALVVVTICVAICAEYLVDSIDDIVKKAHISKTFIGLILLPIVGNAAEHVTAVVVSWKDKMNLALSVAIGSSLQIALFVTPFLVLLGWAMGQEMTLHFQTFETVVFFLSVFVVNYLIADGSSNYLEGCMCIGTYVIIALAFYVYPENTSSVAIPAA